MICSTHKSRTPKKEFGESGDVGQTLQSRVHVARVAEVGETDKSANMATSTLILSTFVLKKTFLKINKKSSLMSGMLLKEGEGFKRFRDGM